MSEPDKKKNVGADLVIPITALAFTLYYFASIWNSPWTAQVSAFFIGTVLIVLIVFFLVKCALSLRKLDVSLGLESLIAPQSLLPVRTGLLLTTLGYVILIQWGGFTLTTWVFLFASMLILNRGKKRKLVAILATVIALSGYLLFVVAFDTRFPRGPFEHLMRWLF